MSAGTLVEADGRTRPVARREVQLQVDETLDERRLGSGLPGRVAPRRRLPRASTFAIEPWLADQELRTSFVYWEGAVRVSGRSRGPVAGQGYVELTGYGRSMQGVF